MPKKAVKKATKASAVKAAAKSFSSVPAPTKRVPQRAQKRFVLAAPDARSVSVCGEFNDWKPDAMPMRRRNEGVWEISVALRPGRYQYKFVVDGNWIHDPNAQFNVPNQHGSLNSVIEVLG